MASERPPLVLLGSSSVLPFVKADHSTSNLSGPPTPEKPKFNSQPTRQIKDNNLQPHTYPALREAQYGEALSIRTKIQESLVAESIGPLDLIHWGTYYGITSAHYSQNDFATKTRTREKNDDGYVGYYHYSNGVSLERFELDIEDYVLGLVGITRDSNGQYLFLKGNEFSASKRELVVTYCTYNIFDKSDFRARYIIHTNGSHKRPVHIDKTYQIIPNPLQPDTKFRKTYTFNGHTVKGLKTVVWEEMRASQIVRLFAQLDDPAIQLCGTIHYSGLVQSRASLLRSIDTTINLLHKGYLTGVRPCYGPATASGNRGDSSRRTSYYRNMLVDALVRMCTLDTSGEASRYAVRHMPKDGSHDYVILKLFKSQPGSSMEKEFVELVNAHIKKYGPFTTQSGLILGEQVKFLISKEYYEAALTIAQKCVVILPLDFEAWYLLSLCYILTEDFQRALSVFNLIPVVMNQRTEELDDLFAEAFLPRKNAAKEPISEKLFKQFFPNPEVAASEYGKPGETVEEGSIEKLWNRLFLFSPHMRHPIVGPHFYHSPLTNSTPKEIASVDVNLLRACGTNSKKSIFASQSSRLPANSLIDFHRKSTWGRCYDLLTFFVAVVGWQNVVQLKSAVFRMDEVTQESNVPFSVDHTSRDMGYPCEKWLEQLFVVVYEDLRTLMAMSVNDENQQHSAIEWEMLGLLGWSVKYKLKESISSLITSVMGTAIEGGFDYFGIVQLLEIYDEFILSEYNDLNIDIFYDDYDLRFYSNKLIMKMSGHDYKQFAMTIEEEFLSLEFVLLNLMKLVSWELRWYQYLPNYLVVKIITKLISKHDLIFISAKMRVVYETHRKASGSTSKSKLGARYLFGFGTSSKKQEKEYEFVDGDTILEYMQRIIGWIENLKG